MQKLLLLFSFLLFQFYGSAQLVLKSNEGAVILANFSYAYQIVGGDMKDRYGNNFNVGGGLDFFTKKNLIFGLQANMLFGQDVKEDVIASIRDENDLIFGSSLGVADIQLRERGIYLGGHIGTLIPFSKEDRRNGIRITLGAGLLQHRVRLQEDPISGVPLITGEYRKGYDQLSNGLAFSEFIGWQFLAKNKRVNFYIGVEFVQGFTENRRSYDFETMKKLVNKGTDFLYGFKLNWSLPFYLKSNADDIYY